MDKRKIAEYFLSRSGNAKNKASELLSLYDGLFALYGKEVFEKAKEWGLDEKRLKAAIDFARGDSDSYKPTELTAKEVEKLKALLQSAICD